MHGTGVLWLYEIYDQLRLLDTYFFLLHLSSLLSLRCRCFPTLFPPPPFFLALDRQFLFFPGAFAYRDWHLGFCFLTYIKLKPPRHPAVGGCLSLGWAGEKNKGMVHDMACRAHDLLILAFFLWALHDTSCEFYLMCIQCPRHVRNFYCSQTSREFAFCRNLVGSASYH